MYATTTHPIAALVEGLHAGLDDLADVDPLYMPTAAKKTVLVELERARQRLAALQMRVMANSQDVTADGAHRSVADYVSNTARVDRAPLAALERLGRRLEGRWHGLSAAVLDGRVSVDKAQVIAKALDLLLEDGIPSPVLAKAESELVTQVRILARKVLDVVAPQIGETDEATTVATTTPNWPTETSDTADADRASDGLVQALTRAASRGSIAPMCSSDSYRPSSLGFAPSPKTRSCCRRRTSR